jgi:hypothetical protein
MVVIIHFCNENAKIKFMKKIVLFSVLSCFSYCLSTPVALAQSEKELRKEWAKKMKNTDPLEFRRISELAANSSKQIADLKDQLNDLQNQLDQKTTEATDLQTKLAELQSKAASASVSSKSGSSSTAEKGNWDKGVVFKVQIGAFRSKDWDLSKYFDNSVNFSGEIDENGIKRYTLGNFRDYWEADRFKKYLRAMGVKDAWIVSFKDNKRVPIKDVLEGVF